MLCVAQTILPLLAASLLQNVHGAPGTNSSGAHCVTGATYCGYILLENQGQ
jgi:hypothetical protein